MGSTLFSKIWDAHVLAERTDGQSLLYVDRHLTHEVTSPMAFESLRVSGRRVRRPDLTFAVMDHNVPTGDRSVPVSEALSANQMLTLQKNTNEYGITLFDLQSPMQGISHVIGPELGLTLPGLTFTCGDSHSSTHGALGSLALGIGTSEGEHVFATQTIWLRRLKQFAVNLRGVLSECVTSKDVILSIIRTIGTGGAIGHVVEFRGPTVAKMSLEERMTMTNMTIEGGARTSIIEPDQKVFDYIRDGPFAPRGRDWDEAMEFWRTLGSDHEARYDRSLDVDVDPIEPQVSWGTNPAMTVGVTESVPSLGDFHDAGDRLAAEKALKYMGLLPNQRISDIPIDAVFIGSCTNARLSDLIAAARVLKGRRVSSSIRAMVVPGSQSVKRRAESLGLHRLFTEAGFEWRNSGCSMCIAMNEDKLSPGERCASTSNRNFENRQGPGGRTHLVSPLTAAAAAIEGRFVDVRDYGVASVEELGLEGAVVA
ncbi:MAG: 3-isopropylmalate dehydratase large subunit [Thaumarchaeota archaeon]|nr:3-isopropylmalate dehydratase large subunit [Nitrososphaerota archaeon]